MGDWRGGEGVTGYVEMLSLVVMGIAWEGVKSGWILFFL